MSSDKELQNDLTALEAALASLVPRTDRLDRDRLMFLAGQASAAPASSDVRVTPAAWRRRVWPAAFAAMTAVAGSLLVMLVTRPGPQVVERIVPGGRASNPDEPAPAAREPAAPSGAAMAAQAVPGNEGLEFSPPWPFAPLVGTRNDGRRQHLADMGLSRAAYLRLLERPHEEGVEPTKLPVGAGAEMPTTEAPPVSYRQLLDSLLKEGEAAKPERAS